MHERASSVPLWVIRLPLCFLLRQPSFGLCVQLLLIPHLAPARLPPRGALVAELGAAPARHVVAPEGELDDRPAAGTPLPLVLLEEVVDHRAVVLPALSVARRVPWMGGLLAGCAEEAMARWAGHLTIECLHWAEEFRTHGPGTVPSIFGWGGIFNRLLFKVVPNPGRY